ncbi:PH domain-containing protein [Haloarchaeobius sp. TZWWS8]|uniref:PH domain-containing protein n=1 Tax=Haloarchaeobius sp. TZWWS8 TaxID=3446121 RepID=UPI003EBEF2FE
MSDVDGSDFDWLTFDEDETVVWSGKPDSKSVLSGYAVGLVLTPVFGLGLAIIASTYLYRENTHYVVTTDGLYKKTGVLSRDVQKIDFEKVQNISFNEGVLGKHFGYGNVDISTAGGSGVEMQFQAVTNPKEVQELVNRHIKRSRKQSDDDEPDKAQVLDEILAELRAIRSSFEGAGLRDVEATGQRSTSSNQRSTGSDHPTTSVELDGSDSGEEPDPDGGAAEEARAERVDDGAPTDGDVTGRGRSPDQER